jgi:hypothetical protein
MDCNELPLEPRQIGVPTGASKIIYEPMVCLAQTVYLSCIDITLSPNRPKRAFTWVSSPINTMGCVQNDFWAYGMFGANRVPILHRHNTVSKQTKTSFHLSLITYKYYGVRSKWFLSLWYVRCKPCTYLALTQTLSLNRPKWDSTWSTSPRSSIECIQNNFWACGMFAINSGPILCQDWLYL